MDNQTQLSAQALLVASLLDDVKAAEQGLGDDLTSKMIGATRLIEGDLSLAQKEAGKLSGAEAQIFVSMATQMEARLRYGYLGNTLSAEGKAELRKAAQLAESAVSRFASAECYLLLSGIYAELGEVGKAREALHMASSGDFGEIDVDFKKSLVRHEEYLNQVARGASRHKDAQADEKGCAITLLVVGALVSLIGLVSNILIFPLGILIMGAGGFNYLKALFSKK
jgi:hypothetical protein